MEKRVKNTMKIKKYTLNDEFFEISELQYNFLFWSILIRGP